MVQNTSDVHIVEVDSASREPPPHSFVAQVNALMRKSALNQKRQSRTNACQLLFPLCMILLLFLLQSLVDSIIRSTVGETIPEILHPTRQRPFLMFAHEDPENCQEFLPPAPDPDFGKLLVTTNGVANLGTGLAENQTSGVGVLGKIQLPQQGGGSSGLIAIGAKKFYDRGGVDGSPATLCLNQPKLLTHLNFRFEDTTAEGHERLFNAWGDAADHILGGFDFTELDTSAGRARYNGFVNDTFTGLIDLPTIMSMVTNGIFRQLREAQGNVLTETTEISYAGRKDFPKPEEDVSFDLISLIGPSIYLYVFFLMMPVFLGNIVHEKENQLREIMKMMGLRTHTYWFVTYIFNYFQYFIATSFMIAIACILGFRYFTVNSFWVYFLLFFVWGHTLCALASFLSVFFNHAQTATVTGYLLVFGSGLIGTTLIVNFFESDDTSAFTLFICQAWPPFALFRALLELGSAVSFGAAGLKLSDLADEDIHLDTVLIYLTLEWFILMILALYLDEVLPSQYGVKKDPLFCLRRKPTPNEAPVHPDSSENKHKVGPDVEMEIDRANKDENIKTTVKLRHLRKEFRQNKASKPNIAVKDLSMVLDYGQCCTWLGSNGAGKSTSISMICGYQEPTSGTAKIFGYDIRHDMDTIHSFMGVCPQDNVLWPDLTGGEHLEFYGRLKRLSGEELEKAVVEGLNSVELLEVRHKKSREYSGGMKRRLCVAVSFMGDPKIVLLDEPTTGLDPASRRGLWNVIKQKKSRCAMLLTTHSMEEAEYLSDKLGIFELGRLRCIGTCTELKHRFENGYKLTLVLKDASKQEDAIEFAKSLGDDIQLLNALGGTLNFEIPTKSLSLHHIFDEIPKRSEKLAIEDWGISNTTLEEVFVRIATDPDALKFTNEK